MPKTKPRAPGVYCQRKGKHRCPRFQVVRLNGTNLCAQHAADQLFSESVRSRGRCEVAEMFPKIHCDGELQCSHIVSRRYHAVRWLEANAWCSCSGHHLYTTLHPLEWEAANPLWDDLRNMALNLPPMNALETVERYRP